MFRPRPLMLFLASTTLMLALAACRVTITPPVSSPAALGDADAGSQTIPETVPGTVPATVPPTTELLSAPLYFLSSTGQIMRLERDGTTLNQLTDEPEPITAFDVSPTDGSLVYVAANNLITRSIDGRRQVKLTGDLLLNDDPTNQIVNAIRSPRISPSGEQMLFALNGVNLAEVGPTPVYEVLRASDPYPDPEADLPDQPIRFYLGAEWSPDSERVLTEFGLYPEGGSFALETVADPRTEPPTFLVSPDADAPFIGDWAWSRDGQYGYIASNFEAFGTPGLALVDAATGFVTVLAPGLPQLATPDAPVTLFRAPHERADGTVLAFVGVAGDLSVPTFYRPHELVDGELMSLTNEGFALWGDVLWSDASDGAVMVLGDEYVDTRQVGSLVWLPLAGDAVTLPGIGSDLRWGPVDIALEQIDLPEVARETRAKAEVTLQFTIDFDLVLETDDGFDGVNVQRLDDAAIPGGPFWVAHTTGFRSFDPLRGHVIAIYAQAGDGYSLVDALEIDEVNQEPIITPDYLFEETVNQVALALEEPPSRVWLNVEGGAGAHSGTYHLLSFDGEALAVEVQGFSSSPGAGFLIDLGNDGTTEVALDATDYYVFCYACAVREVSYVLLRWDGDAFVPIGLTTLAEDEADAEIVSANNTLVALAEANLWRDALDLVNAADESLAENEVYATNANVVRYLGEARRELTQSEPLDFTLLHHIFFGDYETAADQLRPYEIADLLDPLPESTLFAGTVAERLDSVVAEYAVAYATEAVAVQPDSASARYILGWAQNLLEPGSATALENLQRAAELAPEDDLFTKSVEFLQG